MKKHFPPWHNIHKNWFLLNTLKTTQSVKLLQVMSFRRIAFHEGRSQEREIIQKEIQSSISYAAEGLHVLHQQAEGIPLPDAPGALVRTIWCFFSVCSFMPGQGPGGTACGKMSSLKWIKGFHM